MSNVLTSKLTIVSACYYNDDSPAHRLLQSAGEFGYRVSLYGLKKRWNNHKETKIDGLLKHIKSLKTDYILYTDAADSWFINKLQINLLEILLSNNNFVFAHEKNAYPHDIQLKDNICAGQFAANRKELIKVLSKMSQKKSSDDQGLWQEELLNRSDYFVDTNNDFFLSMGDHNLDDLVKTDHGYKLKNTSGHPSIVHFNGAKGGSQNGNNLIAFWELCYSK